MKPRRIWSRWIVVVFGVLAFGMGAAEGRDFIRGDVNTDNTVDITDGVATLEVLFLGDVVYCVDAMDTNDDGTTNLADPIYLFSYLFSGGPPPGAPFGVCGPDPTSDSLDCDAHAPCNVGDAIPGLNADEFSSFLNGRELMAKVFSPEEGLGPLFNAASCEACHSHPTIGGSAPVYRNFFLVGVGDPPDQTHAAGVPSLVMPSYGEIDGNRPTIPVSGSIQALGQPVYAAHRNAPPFFGVGLFEFVSNATIIGNSDPNDSNGDGISGRYNTDGFGNFGRFGYKLQANFLEAFIRGAAFNQMGITTVPVFGSDGIVSYKFQVTAGFDAATFDNDGTPDPEFSSSDFADVLVFNKFVAPPPRKPFNSDEQQGEALFSSLNCVACHLPTIPSAVGNLEAYTDLLLHDMGPLLADGISMGTPQFSTIDPLDSTVSEFRTQPLWGVRFHRPWLHDGRAGSLHEAILLHGGEATAIRDSYSNLSAAEQDLVIQFLEAL